MSDIELNFDWNGDRIRITGARLRSAADADKLIRAITIMRGLFEDEQRSATETQSPAHGGVTGPSSAGTGGDVSRQPHPGAKPVVEAVAGSAMSEGAAVATSPETAETGSRLDAGRTASATSETMDATVGGDESGTAAHSPSGAPEVAASRARKPSPEQSEAEPVRQVGGDTRLPARGGIKQRVTKLFAAHPDWSVADFCREMPDAKYNSVANRLWEVRKAARQTPASAHPAAPAPEAAPGVERSPAPIRPPVAASPSNSAVVITPMRRAPKGIRFVLRDDAGLYLHNSCESMTANRKWAWEGSAEQMLACRRRFPLARDLREQVVEKEAARHVA